jgi:hypothetical protein
MKFVFEIRIKPGHTVEEYAAAWSRGSVVIRRAPGAQGQGCIARSVSRTCFWQSRVGTRKQAEMAQRAA